MVTIGGIPVYDARLSDEETGMLKISLVDEPAVMSDFVAFDKKKAVQLYRVADEEKRLVNGVVMRADFPIYRYDARLGEYYVIYKAETIREMAEKYLADGLQNEVNVMHSTDVEGVNMVQYFIKDSARGVNPEGFDDIADGSLFAEFHVLNDDVWAEVKAGNYRGFSLEGVFDLVPEENAQEIRDDVADLLVGEFASLKTHLKRANMSKINRFKAALAKLLAAFGNVSTDKGVLAWDGEDDLKAGDDVFIEDQEGNRTPAPAGDYVTTDAKTIVVDEDNKVAEIRDPEVEVESEFGRLSTDGGTLAWEGEEDLKEGDEVFIEAEDGELAAAPDGEYRTEDRKVIVVVEGKVAEIRDDEAEVATEGHSEEEDYRRQNAELRAQVEALTKKVETLSRKSAAKPAHEEVREIGMFAKTGVRGIDKIVDIMNR